MFLGTVVYIEVLINFNKTRQHNGFFSVVDKVCTDIIKEAYVQTKYFYDDKNVKNTNLKK